jgi:hypothetical protein
MPICDVVCAIGCLPPLCESPSRACRLASMRMCE